MALTSFWAIFIFFQFSFLFTIFSSFVAHNNVWIVHIHTHTYPSTVKRLMVCHKRCNAMIKNNEKIWKVKATILIGMVKEKASKRHDTIRWWWKTKKKKVNEEKLSCSRINVIDFDKGCFVNSTNPTKSPPSALSFGRTQLDTIFVLLFYQTDAEAAPQRNNVHRRNSVSNYRFVMVIDWIDSIHLKCIHAEKKCQK